MLFPNKPRSKRNPNFQSEIRITKNKPKTNVISNSIIDIRVIDHLKVVGIAENKFIICLNQSNQKFMIIDQHAVHERIRYEYVLSLYNPPEKQKPDSFYYKSKCDFNIPIEIISIQENDATKPFIEQLLAYKQYLEYLNITLKINKTTLVHELISFRIGKRIFGHEELVKIIDKWQQQNIYTIPTLLDEEIKSFCCKNAIKFNDFLTIKQAEVLVNDLKKCDFPYYCIHGRNTIYPI